MHERTLDYQRPSPPRLRDQIARSLGRMAWLFLAAWAITLLAAPLASSYAGHAGHNEMLGILMACNACGSVAGIAGGILRSEMAAAACLLHIPMLLIEPTFLCA
jgi:hypothetical protein